MMSLWDRTILVDRDVVLDITVPGVSHGFILVLEEPANKLAIELKSHVRRRSSCATDLGHDTVNADRVPFDSRSTPLGFNMLNHEKAAHLRSRNQWSAEAPPLWLQ